MSAILGGCGCGCGAIGKGWKALQAQKFWHGHPSLISGVSHRMTEVEEYHRPPGNVAPALVEGCGEGFTPGTGYPTYGLIQIPVDGLGLQWVAAVNGGRGGGSVDSTNWTSPTVKYLSMTTQHSRSYNGWDADGYSYSCPTDCASGWGNISYDKWGNESHSGPGLDDYWPNGQGYDINAIQTAIQAYIALISTNYANKENSTTDDGFGNTSSTIYTVTGGGGVSGTITATEIKESHLSCDTYSPCSFNGVGGGTQTTEVTVSWGPAYVTMETVVTGTADYCPNSSFVLNGGQAHWELNLLHSVETMSVSETGFSFTSESRRQAEAYSEDCQIPGPQDVTTRVSWSRSLANAYSVQQVYEDAKTLINNSPQTGTPFYSHCTNIPKPAGASWVCSGLPGNTGDCNCNLADDSINPWRPFGNNHAVLLINANEALGIQTPYYFMTGLTFPDPTSYDGTNLYSWQGRYGDTNAGLLQIWNWEDGYFYPAYHALCATSYQSVTIQEWAETRLTWPSHDWFRPCGHDRGRIDQVYGSSTFGDDIWPDSWGICGRATVVSAAQNGSNIDFVLSHAVHLASGDLVVFSGTLAALGTKSVLAGVVEETAAFSVAGTLGGDYTSGGFVMGGHQSSLDGLPAYTWHDHTSNGDLIFAGGYFAPRVYLCHSDQPGQYDWVNFRCWNYYGGGWIPCGETATCSGDNIYITTIVQPVPVADLATYTGTDKAVLYCGVRPGGYAFTGDFHNVQFPTNPTDRYGLAPYDFAYYGTELYWGGAFQQTMIDPLDTSGVTSPYLDEDTLTWVYPAWEEARNTVPSGAPALPYSVNAPFAQRTPYYYHSSPAACPVTEHVGADINLLTRGLGTPTMDELNLKKTIDPNISPPPFTDVDI